jgi:hypothetical protein
MKRPHPLLDVECSNSEAQETSYYTAASATAHKITFIPQCHLEMFNFIWFLILEYSGKFPQIHAWEAPKSFAEPAKRHDICD